MSSAITLKGMFRVHLEEDGQIVGDSGWQENVVTNAGLNNYVLQLMAATAGSSRVTHVALGSGAAPASNATSLPSEITDAASSRKAVTMATSDRTLQMTATFASSDNFITAAKTISNIGLFATSTTNIGTILAGNTYTSSALATNQNVNVTYNLIYASA